MEGNEPVYDDTDQNWFKSSKDSDLAFETKPRSGQP